MVSFKVLILSACLVSTAFGKATLGGLPGSDLGGALGGKGGILGGKGGILGEKGGILGGKNGILGGIAGGLHPGGPLGGALGGKGGILGGKNGILGGIAGGLHPGGPLGPVAGILKDLLGGIAGDVGGVKAVIGDVLSLKIPAAVDDVLNIVGITAKAISHIVSEIFPELGQILDGVSQSIVSIARCLLGSQGISGAVLHDHRPGKLNPPHLQCDGHGTDSVDLSKFAGQLGLKKIIKDIEQFIAKILGGQDISHLPKSKVVVIEALEKLSKLLQKTNFSKSDITSYMSTTITIVGSIANNEEPETGTELVKHICKIVGPVLKKDGISFSSGELDQILKTLEGTSNDSGCWGKGSSGSDSESGFGYEDSSSEESPEQGGGNQSHQFSDEQRGSSGGYAQKSGSVKKSGSKLKGQIKNSFGNTSGSDDN